MAPEGGLPFDVFLGFETFSQSGRLAFRRTFLVWCCFSFRVAHLAFILLRLGKVSSIRRICRVEALKMKREQFIAWDRAGAQCFGPVFPH
jgi:hypothetical protein